MAIVGHVKALYRFPVKSMVGEHLERIDVGVSGLPGDRAWAVRNLEAGEQQGARQLPGLLRVTASLQGEEDGTPRLTFPDGMRLKASSPDASQRLSELIGKGLRLVPLEPASNRAHYQKASRRLDAKALRREMGVEDGDLPPDLSSLGLQKLLELGVYTTPPGTYFDAYPIHLMTTSSLQHVARQAGRSSLNPLRYRPNILIDTGSARGLLEPGWLRATLRIGACRLFVETPTIRCAIPGRAQALPGVHADKSVIGAVAQHADRHLGVYARVTSPGVIRVGDPVSLHHGPRAPLRERVYSTQRALIRSAVRRLLR